MQKENSKEMTMHDFAVGDVYETPKGKKVQCFRVEEEKNFIVFKSMSEIQGTTHHKYGLKICQCKKFKKLQ